MHTVWKAVLGIADRRAWPSVFNKAQATPILSRELVPNDAVGLSLGKAHLSKLKD